MNMNTYPSIHTSIHIRRDDVKVYVYVRMYITIIILFYFDVLLNESNHSNIADTSVRKTPYEHNARTNERF